jgi:fibronectin-binding autotransporter adhesin
MCSPRSLPCVSALLHRFLCVASAILSGANAFATIVTWDGGAVNNNWSSARNWQGDTAPVPNDALVFDGFARLASSNDFAANTPFSGLTFTNTAGAFTLSGNPLTLHGDIADNTAVLTQTIALPLVLDATRTISVTDAGALSITGAVSGVGFGLNKTGAGLLTMSGANSFSGSLAINAGTVSIAADTHLGAAPSSASPGRVMINGGTLRTTANVTINANRGIALGPASGAGTGTIDVASGTTLIYSGIIANNAIGTGGLTKTSFGGLTLSGANTYTGPTIVKVGTLTLDFGPATAPANNIVSTTSSLTLGGANAGLGGTSFAALTMIGSAAGNAQTFNGTTIDIGPAIVRVNSAGAAATLNLGSLTHNKGGVVNFIRPAAGNITTTTPNTNGILGGWATVGTGATVGAITVGNEWASVDGSGNVVPFAGHLNYVTGATVPLLPGYSPAANLRVNSGSAGDIAIDTPSAGTITDINTLQFSDASARSIVIGAGNTLRLGRAGGIFRSDATTAAITWVIGTSTGGANGVQNEGTLTAGGAPDTAGEIVFTINAPSQTAGSLNVEARVADNGLGAVSVVKAGPGSMKFRGNNTYSGGTYILQGRFQLAGSEIGGANPDGWGTGPIFVMPGAQAFPSGAGTTPITNDWFLAGNGISDNVGAIRLSSGGTLAGLITLIGDTRLGGGGASAAGAGGGIISGKITGPFNLDFGAVGNSGNGHNVAILTNPANDWSGNTTIVGRTGGTAGNTRLVLGANEVVPDGVGKGNVIIGNAGNTASTCTLDLNGFNETINGLVSAGTATLGFVQNNAAGTTSTLTVGGYDQTTTFDGVIQDGAGGAGIVAVTKVGAGILTLTGANTFTGETNINAGTLAVTGAAATLPTTGVIKINSSASAAGRLSGTVPLGHVTLGANTGTQSARIDPGATGAAGAIGTLTLSSLAVNGGDLQFDLVTPGASDFIDVVGTASFTAPSTISPGPVGAAGTYTLLNAAGGLTLTVPPTLNPPANTRSTFALDTASTPKTIKLIISGGPKTITWTGAINSTWDVVNTTNWTDGAVPEKFFTGDSVVFGNGPANRTIDLAVPVVPGAVTVNNSPPNPYTIGGGGSIGGGASLSKAGDGLLILTTDNNYSGPTTISAGTVQVGAGGSSGSLGTGTISNNGTLVFNRSNTLAVSASIEGVGELRQIGPGTLTLSGTNLYDGPTTVSAGTLQIGNSSALGSAVAGTTIADGATLDLGGGAAVNALNVGTELVTIRGTGAGGAGVIVNSGVAQQNALQQVALAADATIGGGARYDIRGGGSRLELAGHTLTKTGPNQVSLVGTEVTDGNIVVNEGILSIETATTALDAGTGRTITFNSGTTAQFFNLTGIVTRPMIFNGSGIQVGNASAQASTVASNVTLNGDVTFTTLNNSTGALTFTGVIGESGGARGIIKTGNAALNLEGLNTYSRVTTITGGTLNVTNLANGGVPSGIGQSSSAPTNLVLAGGTLGFTGQTAATTDRGFSLGVGGGGLDASGFATAPVTFSNPAPIAIVGNAARSLRLTGTNSDANTLAAQIVDGPAPTSVIKSGVGTWLLTGANSYTGPTTLDEGILTIRSIANGGLPSPIGQSTSAASNLLFAGGTLSYTGPAAATDRLLSIDAAGGIIEASGSGALQFTNPGAVAFTGAGPRTLTLGGSNTGDNTFIPAIADSADVTSLAKIGPGKWTLGSANSYTGATDLFEGTLVIPAAATLANSMSVTVFPDSTLDLTAVAGGFAVGSGKNVTANGSITGSLSIQGTLRGKGTVGPLTVAAGGTVSPGDGVGSLATGPATLRGNGVYLFELRTGGTPGTAGTDWDRLLINGAANLTSLNATDRFIFKLQTVDSFGFDGPLAAWNPGADHTWPGILTTTGGFIGTVSPAIFSVDTSGFLSPIEGTFRVVQNGNALDLVYTIPEPTALAVLMPGIVSLLGVRRRRTRTQ